MVRVVPLPFWLTLTDGEHPFIPILHTVSIPDIDPGLLLFHHSPAYGAFQKVVASSSGPGMTQKCL